MPDVRLVIASFAFAVASCGVRTPASIDVDVLVARLGITDARRDLLARIATDPKDIAARLGLAAIDERDRPSSAIEQLEAVDQLGGPIGTRWRDGDRARLARLLAARGRARLAREASTALADLGRAEQFGAVIGSRERGAARVLQAIALLRHVDAKERVAGMRMLETQWTAGGDPRWAGARNAATPVERGAFGIWLWSVRARRAAWEELRAWHDATTAPRDPAIAAAYLTARSWWVPYDGPPPATEDLVGPDRCRFTISDGCGVVELMKREPFDEGALAAVLASPARAGDKHDAATITAWMQLTLLQSLRGDASWGPAFASRVDFTSVQPRTLPAVFRPAFAILAGRAVPAEGALSDLDKRGWPITTTDRLLFAAGRVLRGARDTDVAAALGDPTGTRSRDAQSRPAWAEGAWLLRVVTIPPESIAAPLTFAAAANVRVRVPHGLSETTLRKLTEAYVRDPAIADRLARDAIAGAVDASVAQASIGALFDALGDPARARLAWQAAVDLGPEIDHLRGLAEATARAKDPDAALVATVMAAAASGDPAVLWVSVARSLELTGEHVHALDAARSAIGLASSRTLVEALDVAIAASAALGRSSQVGELTAQRARITPSVPERPGDPTDAAAALLAYDRSANAGATAQLWVAARWNRRHVGVRAALLAAISLDDPRSRVVIAELVALASDRDPEVGRDAVRALRGLR